MNARPISRNPNTTFTEFNQPPDFGRVFNQPGNAANKPNGSAKANENPPMPTNGPATPPFTAASTNRVPMMGPVQLKETNESVNAMKKIPISPPLSDFSSTLFTKEEGSVISKAPKKDIPKTTKITKNARLKITFVESAFNASAPKIMVTKNPKSV